MDDTRTVVLAILLIATPVLFNAAYLALALRFSYPGILREPTAAILARFREGGTALVLLWWLFSLTALLFVPLAVLGGTVVRDPALAWLSAAVGVSAGLVQALGLLRWVFLVPYLARAEQEGHDAGAVDLVFQAFHRYLGVTVGEHLGYLATGVWTILFAAGLATGLATGLGAGETLPLWLLIVGIVVGAALVVGALEFVGPFEREGWAFAGLLVPIGYVLWSVWLVAVGVWLLVAAGATIAP